MIIYDEELISILRSIIGEGRIINAGLPEYYNKGDVMKYKKEEEWILYKCKKEGTFTIPDTDNFTKIDLRS